MDILVRRFNNESYVWKKAKFVNGQIMVDGTQVRESNIVAIHNDNRKKYVYCSGCGTYFRKGSKKIEEHKAGCDDTSKCFDCSYLCHQRVKPISDKCTALENGKYIATIKTEVSLYCNRSYADINSQDARVRCIHNRCKKATMETPKCFFLDHPGAFDNIATIDKVVESGYKKAWSDSWNERTYYMLKGRNSIEAIVNNLNIVEGFRVCYKRHSYTVYYSKKYNELYIAEYAGTYQKWRPCDMTTDTQNYIKSKIAALYN